MKRIVTEDFKKQSQSDIPPSGDVQPSSSVEPPNATYDIGFKFIRQYIQYAKDRLTRAQEAFESEEIPEWYTEYVNKWNSSANVEEQWKNDKSSVNLGVAKGAIEDTLRYMNSLSSTMDQLQNDMKGGV